RAFTYARLRHPPEVAFTGCAGITQPAQHCARSSVSNTFADGNASTAAVLHKHLFTRKPLFVFEPYLDSYSSKKGTNHEDKKHEDKKANCRNNGQCRPDPRTGRVGARRDS